MRALLVGASGAIGQHVAERLLANGWTVAASYYSNLSRLDALQQRFGSALEALHLDLLNVASIERAIKSSGNRSAGFDAMINVSGLAGRPEFLIRATPARIQELVTVNLTGIICATKFALPFLLRQETSAVLNVSSVAAASPTSGITAYAATKAGIEGFTLALAREYGHRGLSANCARLGPVHTPMLDGLGEEQVTALRARFPGKLLPTPTRIAEVLESFVHQSLHGSINGSILTVDSGYTVWSDARTIN